MSLKLQLESIPIFQFLTKEDLASISAIAKVVSKSKGDAILLHGENVPGIYIVGEGSCGVFPQGATKPLVHIEAGGSFGEMSFLEKTKASATIRADTSPTKLVLLMHTDIIKLTEENPTIGRSLFRGMAVTLSQKLRVTNEHISKAIKDGRQQLNKLREDLGEAAPLENLERLIADFLM